MGAPSILSLLAATGYMALGMHFYNNRWRARTSPAARWEQPAVGVLLLLHAFTLYLAIPQPGGFNLGVGNALSLTCWLAAASYWAASFAYRLESLYVFSLPLAALGLLTPLILPESHILPYSNMAAFHWHLLVSLLAYSLLTIAALHAGLMVSLEKRLHHALLNDAMSHLPPLLTLETLLFRLLSLGFVFLTLTLGTGMLFSESIFGKPLQLNHKVVFGILAWLLFATLLAGRWQYGWRGKLASRLTIAGFSLLLLAYMGSKFVLEILLGRT